MKKLLNLIASAIIVTSPVVSIVSCNANGDSDYTITIQQVSKENAPTGTEDLSKIYENTISNVLDKVKNNDKYKALSKFKFKIIDSPSDNYFVDKIDNGQAQYTSRDMPDVFRTQLSQQNTIDYGGFLPIDRDIDSSGQTGEQFLQSIGLTGAEKTTAKTLGTEQKYWFNDAAITRSKAVKKGTNEVHTFIVPTSITGAAGFFFDKSANALLEYDKLGLGHIVFAKDIDAEHKAGMIVDKPDYATLSKNIENYTFQFGLGVSHNGQKVDQYTKSYVSLNQLVAASEQLYSDSMDDNQTYYQGGDKPTNKSPLNLMAMGNINYLHSRFLEQISAMGLVNSGMSWDNASKIKDTYIGDSWQKSYATDTDQSAYFDGLQDSNKNTTGALPAHAFLNAAEGKDISSGTYGTIFSNENFKDSAQEILKQIFNYNVFESRLSQSLYNNNDTWQTWWTGAKGPQGDDPMVNKTVVNMVHDWDVKTHNDIVRSLMYCLGNSGYQAAAVNMFSKDRHYDATNLPDATWFENNYKTLDFAPIYQLGAGNDELAAPTDGSQVNSVVYHNDQKNPYIVDGSVKNSAAIENLGGGGMAINNKISREKTYKEKLTLIRLFMKEFTDQYIANIQPTAVDQFRQIYDDGDQITPIQVQSADKKSSISAIDIFKQDVDKKIIWNNNMPETNRMKINELLTAEKMDNTFTMESGIPNKAISLNDGGRGNPYDTALGTILSYSAIKAGGEFWNYALPVDQQHLAINLGTDSKYYQLLLDAIANTTNGFMRDVYTKLNG